MLDLSLLPLQHPQQCLALALLCQADNVCKLLLLYFLVLARVWA